VSTQTADHVESLAERCTEMSETITVVG